MTFYSFCQKILSPLVKAVFRMKIYGQDEIPDHGPFILIANHKSYLDPVLLGVSLRRRIYFVAKKELFKIPLFGSLITALGAFPVDRNSPDRKALEQSLRLLQMGEVVGIFPEGTRIRREQIGEVKPGAYLMAKLSGAPVCLACIKGAFPLLVRKGVLPCLSSIVIKFKFLGTVDNNISRNDYLNIVRKELTWLWKEMSL